jgi:hypothetical protein
LRKTLLLLAGLAAVTPARSALVLSEVMADPSVLADAQGEFVELANAGEDSLAFDTLLLSVDGAVSRLHGVRLPPGGHHLACRDSAAMAGAGAACGTWLPRLSLANGGGLAIVIAHGADSSEFAVPPARAGVSWENTFDPDAGFRTFARSAGRFAGGDSATPGYRNSRSLRRAARDLAIASVRLAERDGQDGLEASVEDRGVEAAPGLLDIRLDRDWDGEAETPVATLEVPPGGGTLWTPLGPDDEGEIRLTLSPDENPAGNSAVMVRLSGPSLAITEACPSPEAGPEWAEIRNATADSGGMPRALALARAEWRGRELGEGAGTLAPGEHLLLTEDAAVLRALLGPLKVRVLEAPGWRALRNTGDTLRIGFRGRALDSLVYGSREGGSGHCLARGIGSAGGPALPQSTPTPGYPSPKPVEELSLGLSGRVLDPGGALEAEVRVPPGAAYTLRAFDLEGNCQREIGRGGAGSAVHAWAGEGPRGERLPPGPYILCLSAGRAGAIRQAVIVAGYP